MDDFHSDDRKAAALPLLIAEEVRGFGFPLACDFLKELGFHKYAKPDVHVKAVVRGLGLADSRADDYTVYKSILRIAANQETTPYAVDKLFWLIGSGYFYDHPDIGKQGRVRTDRDGFVRKARRSLDNQSGRTRIVATRSARRA